jgi:crotonobetaine/carnitine-CoA ligase
VSARAESPPANIVELVVSACARDPDRLALLFEDGIGITRHDLLASVERFGGWLAERISPGDRVAIMLENRIEFMIAWLAVVANGGVLVSLNHGGREHDTRHILRDSGAVIAIVGDSTRELVEQLRPSCPKLAAIVRIGDPEPGGLDAYSGPGPLDLSSVEIDPDAVTNVYYTSGTTGPPKGCMLAHDYWLRFTGLYQTLYGLGRDDRLLCCLQFFYGDPPWQMLLSLDAGSTLVAMRRFSVSRFWDVVRRHRITQLFGLASIPSLLMKAPPDPGDREHDVRFALQIGVPTALHRQLVERWGFPWVEGYGLTESGLVISMPLERAAEMTGSGSIGLPCPGVDIRIVDDHGADVACGELGELLLRAPGLMRAYLNRPDATAETLRDGWLHTGDVARIDGRGFVYFAGRKKDIIRRSGENVAASEVEEVLRGHPGVLEVAVVPVPDELRGEEVKAHVLLVDGMSPEALPPLDLIEYCRERLAKHKVPRFLAYRDEPFPRTPSMRVKKSELTRDGEAGEAVWDRERELGW